MLNVVFMIHKIRTVLILLILFFLSGTAFVSAQITAPGASASEFTSYPVFPQNDPVFIFCVAPGEVSGALMANSTLMGSKTFTWERYNPVSRSFEAYYAETKNDNQSVISGLEDGGYRVTVTSETGQEVFRAWVFNFWRTIEASVSESTCDFFRLSSVFDQPVLQYYDLSDGTLRELSPEPEFTWKEGETIISRFASPVIYDPPTRDTDYTLIVSDRWGCEAVAIVRYISIVTRALFTVDPMNGEAPLTVEFRNESENGDPLGFEWFFFKDLDEIKKLSAGSTQPVDSIMLRAYDFSPVYTFENSGTYMVKLVSKKTSEFWTCTDTVYLENYIVADTSYIQAPNVFTPNDDGTNDQFVVKFWSMQEVKISVFNRWGRTVHVFESKNVRGFSDTWEVAAWDGRIGGRDASPGVYYYVIEGTGRDGKKRWHKGFVHLFR
jgi:gliding motility-associated-like protein